MQRPDTPFTPLPEAELTALKGEATAWFTTLRDRIVAALEALEDEYGGMVVDADHLPSGTGEFARSLAASLSYWKSVVRPILPPLSRIQARS